MLSRMVHGNFIYFFFNIWRNLRDKEAHNLATMSHWQTLEGNSQAHCLKEYYVSSSALLRSRMKKCPKMDNL